jgi:hypothetical protein
MGVNGLVLVFALAAGPLALWVDLRLRERAPRTVAWAFVHTVGALMVLRLMPKLMVLVIAGSDSPARKMLGIFSVLLPALVYAWLATIWLLKLVQRAALR